jgi:hypothetical protein
MMKETGPIFRAMHGRPFQKIRGAFHRTTVIARITRYSPYLFFLIPGFFYWFTACRTPGWVDATLIVSNVVNLELGAWVNYHNLFSLLGYVWIHAFPQSNIHYSLVLLSALFGTVTVQLMFLVFLELTAHKLIAGAGAIALMISHSLWWHSTMLEVYTLNTAIIAAVLFLIVRFEKKGKLIDLYLTAFLLGLGMSNHVLMGLFIFGFLVVIGYLIYKRKSPSFWNISLMIGCFLLGTGVYLYAFLRDFQNEVTVLKAEPTTRSAVAVSITALSSTVDDATGGEFKKYMFPRNIPADEKRFWRLNYLLLICYNYPSAAILLSLFGFYCFWKKSNLRLTFLFYMTSLFAQVVWSSNYFIWDMYAFSLPVYLLLSVTVVLALNFLIDFGKTGRILLLCLIPTFIAPPFLYDAVSDDGKKDGIVKKYFRHYTEWEQAEHTWDGIEYLTTPNKRSYHRVSDYAYKIFTVLPQGAHLWNSVGRADYPLRLYYRDIYNMRRDINHHSLFNPFMTQEEAEHEAAVLRTCLAGREQVFFASIAYPERLVLDNLFVLLDPTKDLDWVGSLPIEEYIDLFPGVEIKKIVLFEEEQVWIYRLMPHDIP